MDAVVEPPKVDAAAATTTPPPATDAPPPETPPADKLEENRGKFIENFFKNRPPREIKKKPVVSPDAEPATEPVTEKKPDDVKPPKADEPAAAPPPPPPAKEEPKVIVQKPTTTEPGDEPADEPPLDEQARIDAAVARHMADTGLDRGQRPSHTPEPPSNDPDAHLIEVALLMEQQNPGRYDDLDKRIREFRELEKGYRTQWMRDNPGQKFAADDESHADWYKANEPTFAKRDFERAERELETNRIVAETRQKVLAEIEPELQETRRERQMQKARPVIERAANEAMVNVLTAVPEFEKAMDNGNGAYVLSAEREKAMEDANPALYAIAAEQSDRVIAVVTELTKMDQLGANYRINPDLVIPLPNGEKIRPHAEILDTLEEIEEAIMATPPKDRVDPNGKTFLTAAERQQRLLDIERSKLTEQQKEEKRKALRKAHWSVGPEHIKERIIRRSRNRLEQISKKIAPAKKKDEPSSTLKNGEHKPTEEPNKTAVKPAPRGGSDTATSSDTVDSRPAGLKSATDGANTVLNTWFKR